MSVPDAEIQDPFVADRRRLATLEATGLADASAVDALDRLAALAARVLGAPTALITLVGGERLLIKGAAGLGEPYASERSAPLTHSFCRFVTAGDPLVLPDARLDPRFASSPAVLKLGTVAYAGYPVLAENGDVLGAFCAIDAAPRAWGERELATLADLARIAADEVRSLGRLRTQVELAAHLREAVDARDELMAVLAHDMRSLLQGASLTAQLLAVQEGDPESVRGLKKSVSSMTELVDKLLALKSLELRGLVSPERARPVDLLQQARQAFEPRSAQEGVSLEVECADDLPDVLADPARVQQVLANLIGNAFQNAGRGGVIRLSAERAARGRDGVRFGVHNAGAGIPAELQPHLFNRFWRHGTGPGLHVGLGLSIVKTIVEAHAGTVGVESSPGDGALFWFTLPPASAADEARSARATRHAAARTRPA